MKTRYYLILSLALSLALTSCKQESETEDAGATAPVAEATTPQGEVSGAADEIPAVEPPATPKPEAKPALRQQPKPTSNAAKSKKTATPAKPKGKAETIYVETYGAQGKVWGHVTLNGDRGTGTIHDVDENTLSVTVTRHGNELFAIDQNSRQYVFKIKN